MPKLLNLVELLKNDPYYVSYSFEFIKLLNRRFRGKSILFLALATLTDEIKDLESRAKSSVEGMPKSDFLAYFLADFLHGILRAPVLSMAQTTCLAQSHRQTTCLPSFVFCGWRISWRF
jgi:hypothetical protein